jgi:predicted acylesterase/phospholipase RssA
MAISNEAVKGAAPDYLHPIKHCDLVLKGGITSGVVYPAAVLELAQTYRFACIGGTSAGAIAAALIAAAEYGRETIDENGHGGFDRLADVDRWLAEPGNLFSVFQPSPETAPLFHSLLEINEKQKRLQRSMRVQEAKRGEESVRETRKPERSLLKAVGYVPGILRRHVGGPYWAGAFLGAVIGTILGAIFIRGIWPGLAAWVYAGIALLTAGLAIGWLLGAAFAISRLARILMKDIPRDNCFGMCTGRKSPLEALDVSVLNDWLVAKINVLAGRRAEDPPLTFAELSEKQSVTDPSVGPVGITVRMMTTNLSHQQPYVLPFTQDIFIFKRSEWARFFPPSVMGLLTGSHAAGEVSLGQLEKEYCFLPRGEDLPIAVAARLSLSFPLLMCAVPLYTVRQSAYALRRTEAGVVLTSEDDLQKNWFSDGGISSNFPIHFYDRWLPRRPTFGINLAQLPLEAFDIKADSLAAPRPGSRDVLRSRFVTQAAEAKADPALSVAAEEDSGDEDPGASERATKAVYRPRANEVRRPEWLPIADLPAFAGAAWATAQNHRERMQSALPSYRERIVTIRFAEDEGGLNLAMGKGAIDSIRQKGRDAGQNLLDFNFDEHRWVRFRVLMAQLEEELLRVRETYPDRAAYEKFLVTNYQRSYSYSKTEPWRLEALARVEQMIQAVNAWRGLDEAWRERNGSWGDGSFFSKRSPRPEPSLRVTPRL